MKIDKLVEVMKKLRAPDGCPWDRAQTHQSLMPFIMDECGELLDAIEAQDDANFREELGDVLMHIVLHSVMAEERGAFTFDDVVEGITAKMISRHPHVFGEEAVSSASDVIDLWEKVKAKEKNHAPDPNASKLDGVAITALPCSRRRRYRRKPPKSDSTGPNSPRSWTRSGRNTGNCARR